MYYPDELIDQVSSSNNIVDIIGQHVKMKKKGSRYVGLCPFHNEKTPSFTVSGEDQLYYCFGCGAGGNIFTFLMEYENMTFQEAVQYLAERAGITLPADTGGQDRARDNRKHQMLEANKAAATFYYYQLRRKPGEKAMAYLKGRGLKDETIRNFGLGYAPVSSDTLYRYLKQQGFSDEILSGAGLIKVDNKGVTDRFWNRVMFPIMDINNKVIGFGGRVMGDGLPKYLNSPETELFDKSRNLYGLGAARRSKKDYFLLCEGYMDVISLHQAGFTNAVASLGTAFTPQHALVIKRYVQQVVLTFDSDQAGINAALRAIPILKRAGISSRVLTMKPHKDPDEFIKNLGPEAYEERIRAAKNSFLFEIGVLRDRYDFRDPEQKTEFQSETAKRLLDFDDEMERDNYLEAVALEYDIRADQLRRKVNQMGSMLLPDQKYKHESLAQEGPVGSMASLTGDILAAGGQGRTGADRKKKADSADKIASRMLLSWLVSYPQTYDQVVEIIDPADFRDERYTRLAEEIFDHLSRGETLRPAEIANHYQDDPELQKVIAEIFSKGPAQETEVRDKEKIYSDLVRKVKDSSIQAAAREISDIGEFQKMMETRKKLPGLHISLDQ
ncbi:MAG: DNA primase [Lachnospiraceae bacterium]|nr:DNA primase [Lachnospiraceae bacterium]